MIDWTSLAANSLWILGCAIGLAGISYAAWEANLQGTGLRRMILRPAYQRIFTLAGVLFCLGLAGTSGAIWEILLWALLALAFLAQLAFTWRSAP